MGIVETFWVCACHHSPLSNQCSVHLLVTSRVGLIFFIIVNLIEIISETAEFTNAFSK